MTKRARGRLFRFVLSICIAVLLGVSLFFCDKIDRALGWNGATVSAEGELTIHFVDVGQGDACIIEFPDERKMIIDGGDEDASEKLLSYIDTNVFEGKEGRFDYAILTHSDADHCGSLDDVLKRYPAKVFYRPNQKATYDGYEDPGVALLKGDYSEKKTRAYKNVIEAGHNGADKVIVTDATDDTQNVICPEGTTKGSVNYYEFDFYGPVRDSYTDVNDYSPIMILEYLGKKIALSGDAEKTAEEDFTTLCDEGKGRYERFDSGFTVDMIKLGHHGSATSSGEKYLEAMTTEFSRPSVAVIISCGKDNKYGHPAPSTLSRLEEMGFSDKNIYRTDERGDIVAQITVTDGEASLIVGGVKLASTNLKSWKVVAVALIIGDFVVLIIIPELGTSLFGGKKKKKR